MFQTGRLSLTLFQTGRLSLSYIRPEGCLLLYFKPEGCNLLYFRQEGCPLLYFRPEGCPLLYWKPDDCPLLYLKVDFCPLLTPFLDSVLFRFAYKIVCFASKRNKLNYYILFVLSRYFAILLFRYFASLISASRFVSNWKTRYFPLWAYLLGVHHIPNSPQSPLLNQCESVLGRPHTHWRDKSNDDLWLFLFPFLIFPFIDRRSGWQPEYKSKAARSSTVLTYLSYNYNLTTFILC